MSEEKLTMDDFSAELEASFKKIEEGDMLTGTVISVDEKEVILDLKYYAEGVIRAEDFSNEPGFSLKDAVQVGDEITATVIRKDDGHGNILLSRAEANDILAWEKLAQYKEEKTVLDVKVKGIVNAGVIAYVEGIRGFIPASKLSLNYVEDLNEYLNKDIQVQVFDLDKEKDRLILSAREILREKADEERKEKISNVEVGLVTEGTVESLQPYGAFISLGNGLSGLVHISQICAKRIKHPSAVLAVGDKVKVKVIGIDQNNRINLSIKKVTEPPPRPAGGGQGGRPRSGGGRPGGFAPRPAAPKEPTDFEDRLKQFMQSSDSKLSELRYIEKKGNSRRSRR